jgi:hypothetical protein
MPSSIELTETHWRELRTNLGKVPIVYTHCKSCLDSMPEGESPDSWSRITAFIDLDTGILTVGCKRCEMPIVSALPDPALVTHLKMSGCPMCEMEEKNAKDR